MLLRRQSLEELSLEQILESESAPDCKQKCQRRHYGQQGIVGEGRRAVLKVGVEKRPHRQIDCLYGVDAPAAARVAPHPGGAVGHKCLCAYQGKPHESASAAYHI